MITHSELIGLREDFNRISEIMTQGVHVDKRTGKEFFTGYSYGTLYDWDQYFESIVLLYLGWDTKYIKNGITIFLDNQRDDGFIMRRVQPELSQERLSALSEIARDVMKHEDTEMVKPFFSQIAMMLYKRERDLSWITDCYYDGIKKYILYWLNEKDKNGNGLSTWDSGPHSGMDDQIERIGRWDSKYCEGVDLNCFIYRECVAFSKIAAILGKKDDETFFTIEAERLMENVQKKMWCAEDSYFYDLDERTGGFIKVKSSSGFAPLWAGIATKEQAEQIVHKHLLNPAEFWRAFPVPSYAADEPGYREERKDGDIGCSWRAQTWIPVNYYLFHGLRSYGYMETAGYLARKTFQMIKSVGDREYYNTDSCTGNGLNPFWGWSLLAYFMEMENETGYDPTKLEYDHYDLLSMRVVR